MSQIARAIARSLGLDEDLAEAIALAHDLGHTPFGHTGEDALESCLAPFGGFDHNAQALRVVTSLERRYAAFDGLNLTYETVEGLVKHNGPLVDGAGRPIGRYRERGVPPAIATYDSRLSLRLDLWPAAEAQAAALADDIAYNAHDLDDGLRAGILDPGEIGSVPFLATLLTEIDRAHPGLDPARRAHELTRRVITRLVEDVLDESGRRLAEARPLSADDVRRMPHAAIAFSGAMAASERSIKAFLFPKLYKHARLMGVRRDAETIVRELFASLTGAPDHLPAEWRAGLDIGDAARLARTVADYIAGMTDRFAMLEHARLVGGTPDLRIA